MRARPTPFVTSLRNFLDVTLILVPSSPASTCSEILMPRTARAHVCAIVVLALSLSVPTFAHHVKTAETKTLPVTTSSAKARELYQKGMDHYENLYLERCNDDWRAAVKEDPKL